LNSVKDDMTNNIAVCPPSSPPSTPISASVIGYCWAKC
jgi:hypothetical protein